MKTPRKTEKKTGLKSKKTAGTKKLKEKPAEDTRHSDQKRPASFIDDQEDEFEVPLDELEGFETFNDYDDEDDF